MADDDTAELKRRLDAGEWLSVPEVTRLVGARSRSTVHRWIVRRRMRYRVANPGSARLQRVLHPDDVTALLDELSEVRRAGP